MKKLFIVGTPIGNINDITLRAIQVLKDVDVIACEDTRVTKKFLDLLEIKNKKLISYHNFNEKNSSNGIISLILNENKKVALVSDAGMPTIADPGFILIQDAKKNNIDFDIIPGVSALTTVLAASTMGTNFTFLGFGKQTKEQMKNQIKTLNPGIYVFFVAPHKLINFLDAINEYHFSTHKIFIGRELTKIHQSFYEGTSEEIKEQIKNEIKGEISLVLKIEKQKKEKVNKYSSKK